ncbi:MAG: GspH/FimT family protein [Deltaproteobacteria bacterium]|nr:GspH/FimT family protein [Deltaproteobacteria bacterium]
MRPKKNESGFSVVELLTTIAIIAILAAIAIPAFSGWIPRYRLKMAARDLYSNMQLAKLTAVRQNQDCSITFSTSPDNYAVSLINKTVVLGDYGSGVKFDDPTHSLTFATSPLTFNPRGLSNSGYVYLSNEKNSAYYRVGPLSSGAIILQKWPNPPSWP